MRSDEKEYLPPERGDEVSLSPGYYKTRVKKGGHEIPVHVIERVERDDTGHICSDVEYSVYAWPDLHSHYRAEWDYIKTKPFFMRPISRREFQWMLTIKYL